MLARFRATMQKSRSQSGWAEVRRAMGKDAGDQVTIELLGRRNAEAGAG